MVGGTKEKEVEQCGPVGYSKQDAVWKHNEPLLIDQLWAEIKTKRTQGFLKVLHKGTDKNQKQAREQLSKAGHDNDT